jgi:glycosyltransferase involved in cell wall biosynthesis
LLEAMARRVPAICFDWGGPGEMITEDCGIKVPVRSLEETVKSFAAALQRLKDEPALRQTLARAARDRALSVFGWAAKRRLLETTYARLTGGP